MNKRVVLLARLGLALVIALSHTLLRLKIAFEYNAARVVIAISIKGRAITASTV